VKGEITKALVTGASRGLGRALAVELSARGLMVIGTGRDGAELRQTAELCANGPGRFLSAELDVTDFKTIRKLVGGHPDLDLCFVNAGVAHQRAFLAISIDEIRATLEVNVLGALVTMQVAAASMVAQGRGRIVAIASDAAYRGIRDMGSYVASKHALLGLARTLAVELEGTGVHLTTVCPGPIRTSILGTLSEEGGMRPEDVAHLIVTSALLPSLSAVELRLTPDVGG
jgi:NAD(P)-dependent dehydrogenase (short-subunit alcohol dehydrogenase family)